MADLAIIQQASDCVETVYATHGYGVSDGTDAVIAHSDESLMTDLYPCVTALTGVDADVLQGAPATVDALTNL